MKKIAFIALLAISIKAHSATDQQKNIQGIIEGDTPFQQIQGAALLDNFKSYAELKIFTNKVSINLMRSKMDLSSAYTELPTELAPYSNQLKELEKTVTPEGRYDTRLFDEIANNITFDKAHKEHCNF